MYGLVLLLGCLGDEFTVVDVDAGPGTDAETPPDADVGPFDAGPSLPACTDVGAPCDDGNMCTITDLCTLEGCVGQRLSCSEPARVCNGSTLSVETPTGVCDPRSGCLSDIAETECRFGCISGDCQGCIDTEWSPESLPFPVAGGGGALTDFVIEENGEQHIAFVEYLEAEDLPVTRYGHRLKESSEWVVESIEEPHVGAGTVELAVRNGEPHIITMVSGTLTYFHRTETGVWETVDFGDRAGALRATDLVVLEDGSAHIVHIDDFTVTHTRQVGEDWVSSPIGGDIRRISEVMAVADGNEIHAALGGSEKLLYAHFDGTGWSIDTVDVPAPVRPRIAYGDSALFILYRGADVDELLLATADEANTSDWDVRTIDTNVLGTPREHAMAVDRLGGVHIAFRRPAPGGIRYGYQPRATGPFRLEEIDDRFGSSFRLSIDNDGTLRLLSEESPPGVSGHEVRVYGRQHCF